MTHMEMPTPCGGWGEIHELNDLWPGPYDLLICDACKRERAADEIAAEQEGT